MTDGVNRREFLRRGASAGLGGTLAVSTGSRATAKPMHSVRLGFVGVGGRGYNHVLNFLDLDRVEIRAVCDIVPAKVKKTQNLIVEAGRSKPQGYWRGEQDYKRLCAQDDIDLVVNSTPWRWHTPICVEAMENGKHAAVEVPAAVTVEECWQLVETAERTGLHCVMLENCCYDEVELMVLNMVRQGLLGELLHAECGYLHDLRDLKFSLRDSKPHWRLEHSLRRNGDLYPTHGLGPVAQCMNINRGNRFDHLVSMSSKARGLNLYAAAKFGPDDPRTKLDVSLGDVVTTMIRTQAGETITVTHDTNTPRPYTRNYLIQGTKGIVRKYPHSQVYFDGRIPAHAWDDLMGISIHEWEHPLWKGLRKRAKQGGHGGMDYIQNYRLIASLLRGESMDMDVYDAAAWSAVSELSERSIASKSRTVDVPDFTRGKWQDRTPLGIVEP